MLISGMKPWFNFRDFIEEVVFVIVVHVVVFITLEVFYRILTDSQTIFLSAVAFFTAYFRMGLTYLSFFLFRTYFFALR